MPTNSEDEKIEGEAFIVMEMMVRNKLKLKLNHLVPSYYIIYGTLTSIDESPIRFGLIYTGSDDGLVHVSQDGGYTWKNITDEDWGELWVSRVEASSHELGRVYVTLNGYRWDHFAPYVYRSDDFGETWYALHDDLPMEPVNVILEDTVNPSLLYLGTDHGLYASIDGGDTFMAMQNGLPHVAVHDLKIQSRQRHLLVGTHGRSIYRVDVAAIQGLTLEVLQSPLKVFPLEELQHHPDWGRRSVWWKDVFAPEVTISYWAGSEGDVLVEVRNTDDIPIRRLHDQAQRGLNFLPYDLSVNTDLWSADSLKAGENGIHYLPPGEYRIYIHLQGTEEMATFRISEMPSRRE